MQKKNIFQIYNNFQDFFKSIRIINKKIFHMKKKYRNDLLTDLNN